MNKKEAYNILTQLLSDIQDIGFEELGNEQYQEYQEAINYLYNKCEE